MSSLFVLVDLAYLACRAFRLTRKIDDQEKSRVCIHPLSFLYVANVPAGAFIYHPPLAAASKLLFYGVRVELVHKEICMSYTGRSWQ